MFVNLITRKETAFYSSLNKQWFIADSKIIAKNKNAVFVKCPLCSSDCKVTRLPDFSRIKDHLKLKEKDHSEQYLSLVQLDDTDKTNFKKFIFVVKRPATLPSRNISQLQELKKIKFFLRPKTKSVEEFNLEMFKEFLKETTEKVKEVYQRQKHSCRLHNDIGTRCNFQDYNNNHSLLDHMNLLEKDYGFYLFFEKDPEEKEKDYLMKIHNKYKFKDSDFKIINITDNKHKMERFYEINQNLIKVVQGNRSKDTESTIPQSTSPQSTIGCQHNFVNYIDSVTDEPCNFQSLECKNCHYLKCFRCDFIKEPPFDKLFTDHILGCFNKHIGLAREQSAEQIEELDDPMEVDDDGLIWKKNSTNESDIKSDQKSDPIATNSELFGILELELKKTIDDLKKRFLF